MHDVRERRRAVERRLDALHQPVRGAEEQVAFEAVDRRALAEDRQAARLGARALDPRPQARAGRRETQHVDAGEGDDEEQRRGQQPDRDAPEEAEGGGHRPGSAARRVVGGRHGAPLVDERPDQHADADDDDPVANTPTGIAPITGAPKASASAEAPATIQPFAGPFMPSPVASSVRASEW